MTRRSAVVATFRWLQQRFLPWLCLLWCSVAAASSSGWVQSTHLKAELVSEYRQLQPGQTVTLALNTQHEPHWHSYWLNPGDSGLATTINWQLPEGVSAGAIQWPTPKLIKVPPLVNYGYEDQSILLTDLQIPADFTGESLVIVATVDWLVCQEICIPATASFSLTLPVAANAEVSTAASALFVTARQALPQALTVVGRYQMQDQSFSAVIELPQDLQVNAFFVGSGEIVDHAANQQMHYQPGRGEPGQLTLRQPQNTYFSQAPTELPLVLITASGAKQLLLHHQTATSPAIAAKSTHTSPPQTFALTEFALMLLFALVGGLILNLMPCVFPVLSLKALSLSRAGQQLAAQRAEALWYSLGVVVSFVALAALLLLLRAGGESLGWGFQLQNPLLVALLAFLLFALGLSLSGLLQFGLGLMNSGQQLTQQSGHRGSFFTGVLAVVVASPCTAPMMGTALGYAATQSAPVALLVFTALGLGMALPFLLLAMWPQLSAKLPKPGSWMEQLKHWLAIPLYLSAVWLLWVYGRQTSIDALALALLGLVALAVACWQWGLVQVAKQQGNKTLLKQVIALIALLLALLSISQPELPATSAQSKDGSAVSQSNSEQGAAEAWSAVRLQELRAQGKPVLVNMTADWCITCLVNERVALNTEQSKDAMQQYQLSYLKGDWTKQDPAISAYLKQYGRDGVPLYVLYFPGQDGQVLPQILTPNTLSEVLAAGPQQSGLSH
ncbi:protein-disulfide reductase DsbD family protein [Rheinheimera riviphila]|uniref:protein-disulfide reductase DsbD family protein n=1 Tax=Rheinheimera riviphila TaxID=1834037 RepID=UPI001F0C9CAD|nr:protein-disulfide reductase DsbD domain-containing protein [Rheinheimera riviphila]